MGQWLRNIFLAIKTVGEGMYVTLWYFFQTFKRRAFTEQFEYPELPVPVKPRYRGFHRFDLTTCIGCDKCARACPVDCIYIEKIKNPVGKGLELHKRVFEGIALVNDAVQFEFRGDFKVLVKKRGLLFFISFIIRGGEFGLVQ